MAGSADITGLDRWKERVRAIYPEVQAEMQAAIQKNADEFSAKLHATIPTDTGDLASTIRESSDRPLAITVTVGDAEHCYAAAVEFGHLDHGHHVPPRPFFFTSLRVLRKKFKGRMARAIRKGINNVSVEPGNDGGEE